mgnify:CR=1 FL=1
MQRVNTYRYASPVNAAEILMTMSVSPIIAAFIGTEPEIITPLKIAGGIAIVFGIMMTEPKFFGLLGRLFHAKS